MMKALSFPSIFDIPCSIFIILFSSTRLSHTERPVPTYRLLIEYDGAAFSGWQIQPDQPTVQEALEQALAVVLNTRPAVIGSGRTDTGVHAQGQVAHFQTEKQVDTFRLQRSLNGLLPHSIAILALEKVADDFHARYDARLRRYHYHVSTEPRALDRHLRWFVRPAPDFDMMNDAATALLGTRHFGAFCHTRSETRNRICTLHHARWIAEDRPGDWRFEIAADRFLHGMVRAIVGTLVEVGHKKRPADDLVRVLASQDRREAGPAAPAHGLVLETVSYEDRP
jgi:tRNA pseudouridine38-40 synthase